VLEQQAPDSLHDAAGDLAFDNARVDHHPALFAHDVPEQTDHAGSVNNGRGRHSTGSQVAA
jgi:hypothetical protein